MKYLLAIAVSFTAGVLVTAAGVPMKVHYVGHEQVASTMVKGGQIIGDGEAAFVTGVPVNTPHWWKDTSKTGSVGYYAVNIEQ